jgi:hypothetical protein
MEPRRQFLYAIGGALCGNLLAVPASAQGPRRGFPTPPPPAETGQGVETDTTNRQRKSINLREHEQAFRACLTSLADRVNQLNHEIEGLHSSDVFSVKVFKESNEIEHLAKQLKSLAKG